MGLCGTARKNDLIGELLLATPGTKAVQLQLCFWLKRKEGQPLGQRAGESALLRVAKVFRISQELPASLGGSSNKGSRNFGRLPLPSLRFPRPQAP